MLKKKYLNLSTKPWLKMIKKLILITGILLSTSLWADMDYTCDTFVYDSITVKQADLLGSLCELSLIHI